MMRPAKVSFLWYQIVADKYESVSIEILWLRRWKYELKRTEIKSSVSYCPPWRKQLNILTLESQRNLFSRMCSTRYKCSRKIQEKGHQLTLVPQVVGDYGRWQLKVVLLLWIPMFFCGTQFVTTDYMNMQVFLGNQTRSSALSSPCFSAKGTSLQGHMEGYLRLLWHSLSLPSKVSLSYHRE